MCGRCGQQDIFDRVGWRCGTVRSGGLGADGCRGESGGSSRPEFPRPLIVGYLSAVRDHPHRLQVQDAGSPQIDTFLVFSCIS